MFPNRPTSARRPPYGSTNPPTNEGFKHLLYPASIHEYMHYVLRSLPPINDGQSFILGRSNPPPSPLLRAGAFACPLQNTKTRVEAKITARLEFASK